MKMINKLCVLFATLTAFTLAGCGSSGSNPASVDDSITGFSTITGSVKGSERATVSFYTSEAVMKQKISEVNLSARASVANTEGVYSVEAINGRYSVVLPENDYYVVASGKNDNSVTGYAGTVRAVGSTVTQDFTLTKVNNVTGKVEAGNISVSKLIVSIANTPFLAVTDDNGNFTFNNLPVATYSVYANCNVDSINYEGSTTVLAEDVEYGIIKNSIVLKPTGSNKKLEGKVYNGSSETNYPASGTVVYAYSTTGEMLSTVTDKDGSFIFHVKDGTDYTVTVDFVEFKKSSEPNNLNFYLSSSSPCILCISEEVKNNTDFQTNTSSKLHIYRVNGSDYDEILEEQVGLPLTNYTICDLLPGQYVYMIESYLLETMTSYLISDVIEVKGSSPVDVKDAKNFVTYGSEINGRPEVSVNDDGKYWVKNLTIAKSDSMDSYISIKACAKNTDDNGKDYTKDLSIKIFDNQGNAEIDTSFIDKPGEYMIYVEYGVRVGNTTETIKSEAVPYVKHGF